MARDAVIKLRPLVFGIGNSIRGDDAIGIEILQRLKRYPLDADFIEVGGDAASLLATWRDRTHVIAIDAAELGEIPGTIRRIDVAHRELPMAQKDVSSHGFGLAEAIELARALDRLPPYFIVFAIQGKAFDQGRHLSATIEQAIPRVERKILKELESFQLEEAH